MHTFDPIFANKNPNCKRVCYMHINSGFPGEWEWVVKGKNFSVLLYYPSTFTFLKLNFPNEYLSLWGKK